MGRAAGSQDQSVSFTVQEKGEIYFFFKPKVGVDKPHTGDEVQRLLFVLRPQAAENPVEEKQSSEAGKEGQLKEAHDEEESNPTDLKKPDAVNKEEETKPEGGDDAVNKEEETKPEGGDDAVNKEEETKPEGGDDAVNKEEETKPEGGDDAVNKEEETKPEGGDGGEKSKSQETPGEEKNGTEAENATKTKEGEDIERIDIGEKPLFRYMVMGRKSLPDVAKGKSRPYWGFVELVTTNPEDLKQMLSEDEYDTKTRGHRVNPAARPVGEGRYSIVQHHSGNRQASTHLVYKLEHPGPHKKHDPQDVLNIEPQASFVIQVKNPKQPTPASANAGSKRPALLPAHLLGGMGSKRFVPLDPPDLLNYEGVEFLLISTRDELVDSEVDDELETSDSLSEEVPDFMEHVVSSKDHEKLIRPLFEGVWA